MYGRWLIPVADDREEFIKLRLPSYYYNMVGANQKHYYVAYVLPGGSVEVRFFRLPLIIHLPYAQYQKELVVTVEQYLMKQHEIMTDAEKSAFAKSLYLEDGKIGAYDVGPATRFEFGYVALNVRKSIMKSGMSITDFSDINAALDRTR